MSKKHTPMKTLTYACTSLLAALYLPMGMAASESTTKMVNFLAGSNSYIAKNNYMGVKAGDWYPLSYVSDATDPNGSAKFWGEYVCQGQCAVQDIEDANNYHLWPSDPTSIAGALQFERIDAVTGTNIYDAATIQIALAVAANKGAPNKAELLGKVNKITDRVANLDPANNNKATGTAFSYGDYADDAFGQKNPIRTSKLALDFRMVGQSFLTQDPFMTRPAYASLIDTKLLDGSKAQKGDVSWVDWKPIMGENAWGLFVGPVQAAYLESQANNQAYVNFKNTGIQNAIYALFAVQRMQSPMGAIYYAPKGTYGNAGNELVKDGEISTENNASMLSGLRMLSTVLSNTLAKQGDLSDIEKLQIKRTLNLINIMIYGGKGPAGSETLGLLNYFKNYAWNGTHFYQGGVYSVKDKTFTPHDPEHSDPGHKFADAVDVNTWGLSVVGPKFLDEEVASKGATLRMFKDVFDWGGYKDASGKLIGVGFSSLDEHKIISGEWTAGAINALAIAIDYYQNGSGKGSISAADLTWLQTTKADMEHGLSLLHNDKYPTAGFPDTQVGYPKLPANEEGLVYASKRYYIPFGWYANPILSAASTSWAVMLDYKFNPFALGGAYDDYKHYSSTKPNYDSQDPSGAWTPATPVHVKVKNAFPDQTINVAFEDKPNNWKKQNANPIPVGGSIELEIPLGTYAIGINYGPNSWGACTLTEDQVTLLASGATIVGGWKDKQGACDVQ